MNQVSEVSAITPIRDSHHHEKETAKMNETKNEESGIWSEFLKFAIKGNAIDLAVAVVVGGAFAKIIGSIVNDIVMPLANPLMPDGDWRNFVIGPGVRIGNLMGALLDFTITALALFFVIHFINKIRNRN
jgi:large conductance mechanosensitive channel